MYNSIPFEVALKFGPSEAPVIIRYYTKDKALKQIDNNKIKM
jgi:hypothetical protein